MTKSKEDLARENTKNVLDEIHSETIEQNTQAFKAKLEAQKTAKITVWLEKKMREHIKGYDDKGNPVTYWDDVKRITSSIRRGEQGFDNPLNEYCLYVALAKAMSISFQQTVAQFGIQSFFLKQVFDIYDKFDKSKQLNIPPFDDVLQYNVQCDEGKLRISPLRVNGVELNFTSKKSGKNLKDEINNQFNTLVQVWMQNNHYSYEEASDSYVSTQDQRIKLTKEKFDEINSRDSLESFLNSRGDLVFEQQEPPNYQPSP